MQFHRSEEQITSSWEDAIDKPVVSICCLTYNHREYVAKAIDGFLIQKTSFPFEVIIHDDASLDGTQNIVNKYADAYPKIIKTIIQTDNKYSKNINPGFEYLLPAARGEYIAFCEGDDFWIDPYKLEIQIDWLKKNPNIDISFHPSFELIDSFYSNILSNYGNKNKVFNTSQMILGDGDFCPTCSLVIRRDAIMNMPKWSKFAPAGDYMIQVLCSTNGGALYIPKVMSVYRRGHPSSWSVAVNQLLSKKIHWYENSLKTMLLLDVYLDKKFSSEISSILDKYSYMMSIFCLSRKDLAGFRKYFYLVKNRRHLGWKFILLDIVKTSDRLLKVIEICYRKIKSLMSFFLKLRIILGWGLYEKNNRI